MTDSFPMLLIGLLLLAAPLQEAPAPAALPTDTAAVTLRLPDGDPLAAYRDDPDFDYAQSTQPTASLWDRFWAWVWSTIFGPIFQPEAGPVRRIVFFALLAVVLGFALRLLLGMNAVGAFGRAARRVRVGFDEVGDDLQAVDLAGLTDGAAAAADWPRAIRLAFLHVLQRLEAAGEVVFGPDKTNHAYLRELRTPALADPFTTLTHLFEYATYGEFAVTDAHFERMRHARDRLFQRLDERLAVSAEVGEESVTARSVPS